MQRHKIGLYSSGVSAMESICDLLEIGADPITTFQEFAAAVGNDLNGQPIEAGLPVATWTWDVMPQKDFDRLLVFANQRVYIRTRNNSGASGFDFANYAGYCSRATGEPDPSYPLARQNVSLSFVALVVV